MSVLLLLLALVEAQEEQRCSPDQAKSAVAVVAGEQVEQADPRPLFEIHKHLRKLMRDEAVQKDRKAWERTVVDLVKLYGEITRDDRLMTSDALNSYRVKLRARLLKVQKRLERETDQQREDRERAGIASSQSAGDPGTAASLGRAGQAGKAGSSATGAAGGAAFDHGESLAELIRRTISPEFWDVNGGPGTIVYYRQWHALVIRATPEIHRKIGGAIGGARK